MALGSLGVGIAAGCGLVMATQALSGYFASPWPCEDAGPARLQVPHQTQGLNLQAQDSLQCTSRRTQVSTMTVLGEPGEVYLLTHSALRSHLGLPTTACVERIDPRKDVDGLHAHNVAALAMGRPGLRPCTPAGCIEILDRHSLPLEGAEVIVIGRSMLVGKPFAFLALERNATVTMAHSRSRDLPALCRRADLVVAAVGRPLMVKGDWIRPGATVLDVGINRLPDGRLVGDVDYAAAVGHAGAITPVPGGIGPMTIAMLLANTLQAARTACR